MAEASAISLRRLASGTRHATCPRGARQAMWRSPARDRDTWRCHVSPALRHVSRAPRPDTCNTGRHVSGRARWAVANLNPTLVSNGLQGGDEKLRSIFDILPEGQSAKERKSVSACGSPFPRSYRAHDLARCGVVKALHPRECSRTLGYPTPGLP